MNEFDYGFNNGENNKIFSNTESKIFGTWPAKNFVGLTMTSTKNRLWIFWSDVSFSRIGLTESIFFASKFISRLYRKSCLCVEIYHYVTRIESRRIGRIFYIFCIYEFDCKNISLRWIYYQRRSRIDIGITFSTEGKFFGIPIRASPVDSTQKKCRNWEFSVLLSCSLVNLEQKTCLWLFEILTPWCLKWPK